MAESSPKQPAPNTLDRLTVERTVKFLWEGRRLNKFKERAQLKKLAALQSEVEQSQRQIRSFSMRLDREFDKHPDVFKSLGLSRDSSDGSED